MLLTTKDVAKQLAVSERTVRDLYAAGKLAAYRVGNGRGVLRFSQESIDTYLREYASGGGGEPESITPIRRRLLGC